MAGKTLTALEKIALQLTCPIHLEAFVDPRLLACHHVFCRKCLHDLADKGTKVAVICPTCRHITRLPQDGTVDCLPAAFDILWLFELRETLLREQKEASDWASSLDDDMSTCRNSPPLVPPRNQPSPTLMEDISIPGSNPPPIPPRGTTTPPPPRSLTSTPTLTTSSPSPTSLLSSLSSVSMTEEDKANLKMENWYIECSREDAKQLLLGRQDGTFIIRPAGKVAVEQEGIIHTHTIDIINKSKICHIKILLLNGKYGLARGSCIHESLSKLVMYYSKISLQCHNSVIMTALTNPAFAVCR